MMPTSHPGIDDESAMVSSSPPDSAVCLTHRQLKVHWQVKVPPYLTGQYYWLCTCALYSVTGITQWLWQPVHLPTATSGK